MSNLKIDSPHFFKKGKLIKFKNLDKNCENREYIFSTEKTGIQTIINQCNNLNQIIARCFLTISKISHYFGISKDISKDISKNKIPFNQFKSNLAFLAKNDFENLFKTIERQNDLTNKLEQSISKLSTLLENSAKNNLFVEKVIRETNIGLILQETDKKIVSIQEQLKHMIG